MSSEIKTSGWNGGAGLRSHWRWVGDGLLIVNDDYGHMALISKSGRNYYGTIPREKLDKWPDSFLPDMEWRLHVGGRATRYATTWAKNKLSG